MQRGFPEVAELLGKGGKQFPCPARPYTWQMQHWCCLAHLWPFPSWNLEVTLDATAG